MKMEEQERNDKGLYKCDCCGGFTVTSPYGYGTSCPDCGWINDSYDAEFPDRYDGYNYTSLNEAKKIWAEDHITMREYRKTHPEIVQRHMRAVQGA